MKEYEYITYGIESVLVDELVGVICQESLEGKSYPDGFRRICDKYRTLRQRFKNKSSDFGTSDFSEAELGTIAKEFESERNCFLETFLIDIKSNYPNLDVCQLAKNYINAIGSDDVVTTEKRVCIYPDIISQARKSDEKEYENGTHN